LPQVAREVVLLPKGGDEGSLGGGAIGSRRDRAAGVEDGGEEDGERGGQRGGPDGLADAHGFDETGGAGGEAVTSPPVEPPVEAVEGGAEQPPEEGDAKVERRVTQ